ncbi:hypothetical protein [Sorangium sp. So ce693]|uniref:hypothetical protein n=1 Tax=Sorangium sp. So ce693 TaxID=3133318 RepID=UPI003F62420F
MFHSGVWASSCGFLRVPFGVERETGVVFALSNESSFLAKRCRSALLDAIRRGPPSLSGAVLILS